MSEITKTTFFAVAAVFAAGAALATYKLTEPAPVAGFEHVGTPFWPKFKDPNAATALRVAAFDENSGLPQTFTVELKDGKWRIPSHHNYPAEGKQHLADLSASVVGIEREALASRWKSDHEKFGVVDPLQEAGSTRGRGKRITLYQDKGKERATLADYIIGKPVEDRDGYYYVRRPDENETYFAKVEVKLTTKFSDWIEPDLLKLQQDDLRKLEVSRPRIDPAGRVVGMDKTTLTRNDAVDPWKMDGLSETEELKTDRVRQVARDLDDLKIVGVRPKPAGLTPQLRLDPKVSSDPRMESALRQELREKGFYVGPDPNGNPVIISREGELTAVTHDGIVYHLHFGDLFSGNLDEIEIGTSASKSKEGESETSATAEESGAGEDAKDEKGLQLSRYLFVRVEFDENRAMGKPTEPVKPDVDENAPVEAPKPDDPPPKDPLAEYEKEMQRYKADLEQYEKKLADARKKVDELNDRFGDWYYVVSGDRFENLRFSREDLVQPKKAAEKPDDAASAPGPEAVAPAQPPADPVEPPFEQDAAPAGKDETEEPEAAEADPAPNE